MRVADIMTRSVLVVGPRAPVPEIARLMWQHRVSGVPVVDEGRVIGIVTELDLLVRNARLHWPTYVRVLDALIPLGNPRRWDEEIRRALGTVAEDVMSRPVITIRSDADVADAATLMLDKRVNPLPVVDDGRLVGIVSRADFVRLLAQDVPID
ncbi:MAG TPA: CBS domain-containing protein [Chloroflexota bacterium]|jgi:CBS domain-containing protein|nr:CBS domain-containing protein [Chloroflexota bacterium]